MRICRCGADAHRIHRTWTQRFTCLAIYRCNDCGLVTRVPRPYWRHFGELCGCPNCGAANVTRRTEHDQTTRAANRFLDFLEKLLGGGKRYFCPWRHLEFYDRRNLRATGEVENGMR